MNAVATKPRAVTTRPSPRAKLHGPNDIQTAFAAVGVALTAACVTEEPHEWSGDSDRLLRIASDIAEREAQRLHGDYEAENYGYDIAALIKASRRVPRDTESPKRTALLEAVDASLSVLTKDVDCLKTGASGEESPTAKERRELAFECNYEISMLAETMKKLLDGEEERPVANGLMGRIEQLSEVVFYAMRLHGESDDAYGGYDHRKMKAFYDGRLS